VTAETIESRTDNSVLRDNAEVAEALGRN